MNQFCRGVVLVLLLATQALGGPVTVAWDPNPPEEAVERYCVWSGAEMLWCGPETQATVELDPGSHVITATAENLRGVSPPSDPLVVPAAATVPKNMRVTFTLKVDITQ